ncbi:MAG: hypothetical protein PHU33_16635 [Bacteroidales bacterium]|nr:hypothetical protein [Bacteroidales bacterium]
MYPVSDNFLNAIESPTRNYSWSGTITTKNQTTYHFTNSDILKGSGYITRQCCGNSEIELGSVFAAELGITLLLDIDRYTLEGATISIFFSLTLADGTTETIPMGVFEISEANRLVKCLEIKAYDYMLRFEKELSLTSSSGKASDFIMMACEQCNVPLALTPAQINSFPNGNDTLGLFKDNDMETYRDLLYYIAQVLGCFCQINRLGQLTLVKYGNTPVQDVPASHRFDSSYSDFKTRYTAITSTNLITEQSEYYALDIDDGLTLNLGTNPFMQFGLVTTRERFLNNILNAISVIDYIPFDSQTIGNPAFDPGDILTFSGGQADAANISCITSIAYNLNGKQTLKCVGKNPRLTNAKSKSDKNITDLLNQVDSNKTVVYNFVNAAALSIGETAVEILNINFTAKEETSAMFLGEILLDVTATDIAQTIDGTASYTENTLPVTTPVSFAYTKKSNPIVTVSYKINNEELPDYYPTLTCIAGKQFLTLFLPISNIVENSENTLSIFLKVSSGSATIGEAQIRATISGQGLVAGIGKWDGRINISEEIVSIIIPEVNFLVNPLSDGATAIIYSPASSSINQGISLIPITATEFGYCAINEQIVSNEVIKSFTLDLVAPYPAMYEAIIDMSHETISGIQLMTAEYSGTVTVTYSVDNGVTFSDEIAIATWLTTNLTGLWNSLNSDKILILHFLIPEGAALSRFKITYTNY